MNGGSEVTEADEKQSERKVEEEGEAFMEEWQGEDHPVGPL